MTGAGAEVARDDIKGLLRAIIKPENLSSTSLAGMREELARHFHKPKEYFDERKGVVNELILETLHELHQNKLSTPKAATASQVKQEGEFRAETPEKRPNLSTESFEEVERSPKVMKQTQAGIMTRTEFLANAPKIKVQIEDNCFILSPRTFSTESCGWYASEKIKLDVNGKSIVCQVGLNCTVVGSKQWKP